MGFARHRQPTPLEQLVGVQRARRLRRRLGWLLIGAGVKTLQPRVRLPGVAAWLVTGAVAGALLVRVLPV